MENERLKYLTQELCLSIDDYSKPKVLYGMNAKTSRLLKLLYMKPGTFPSSPDMGINISSYKFELMNSEVTAKIQSKIESQVEQYLPELHITDIMVTPYKGYLVVAIEEYDDQTQKTNNIGVLVHNDHSLSQIISN